MFDQFLASIPPELQNQFKAMANKGDGDDDTPEEERPNPDNESVITFHTTNEGIEDKQDVEMTDKQMAAVPEASTTVHAAGSGVDTWSPGASLVIATTCERPKKTQKEKSRTRL
jgi:hypothetical protein